MQRASKSGSGSSAAKRQSILLAAVLIVNLGLILWLVEKEVRPVLRRFALFRLS